MSNVLYRPNCLLCLKRLTLLKEDLTLAGASWNDGTVIVLQKLEKSKLFTNAYFYFLLRSGVVETRSREGNGVGVLC